MVSKAECYGQMKVGEFPYSGDEGEVRTDTVGCKRRVTL